MLLGMGMESLKVGRLPSNLSGSKIADGSLHSVKYFREYCVLLRLKVSAWNISHTSMCVLSACVSQRNMTSCDRQKHYLVPYSLIQDFSRETFVLVWF